MSKKEEYAARSNLLTVKFICPITNKEVEAKFKDFDFRGWETEDDCGVDIVLYDCPACRKTHKFE